ncbi:MAG: hypothetical protein AAF356_08990 [Planctomycetota bacterium]
MHQQTALLEAAYSPRFLRFFSWWGRDKMLAKKFSAVRAAPGTREALAGLRDHAGPVICCTNHVGWWDPIVMLALHRDFLPGRSLRAPMHIEQLRRFNFFRRLGTFGIDPDDPASIKAMDAYLSAYFRGDSRDDNRGDALPTLWINPQGRFADVREPVVARPGAAKIAAGAADARCVAVQIEYPFLTDAKPEVWVRAAPIEPDRPGTTGWHRAIVRTMEDNRVALGDLVTARDPEAMIDLIGGEASNGNPIFDLWLRLRGRGGGIDDARDRAAVRQTGAQADAQADGQPRAGARGGSAA